MVLTKELQKKILDFVFNKPRTIQEISHLIGKNWRTADTYVEKISQETGLINGRTFRGGTRGALKIVFWNNTEKINSSQFQERLFKQIEHARRQEDFSPLDIYQYIDKDKKRAFSEVVVDEKLSKTQDIVGLFARAERQILYFSGNMSFLEMKEKKKNILEIIEEAAKRGVSIKVLARIDIASLDNFRKMMEINHKIGREAIEIRHAVQPLRGFIIDDKEVRLKEEKNPEKYKKGELKAKTRLFYEIYDPEWVVWIQKVFWNLFRTSIDAKIRVKDLEMIKKL
ncbi:hypothetical protein JW711_01045 [Candidatus Woesearchaeota archaeon]|nr:hypothetical protein [Candidatus Woesearchaeota archaeon]